MAELNPKANLRAPRLYYAELAMAPGPPILGDPQGQDYTSLFGKNWAVLLDRDTQQLRAFQDDAGAWVEKTQGLPDIFNETLPDSARRITFCFDQSARIIFAHEEDEVIYVSRWDQSQQAYVQNVSFSGVDPQLFMDATIGGPDMWPSDIKAAFDDGIRVFFEWIPDGSWRESAIGVSDVLLFYLSPDRLNLYVRVQRQIYATPVLLHTFSEPVVLDQVTLSDSDFVYQLLFSTADGTPSANALLSDPYIGSFLAAPETSDSLSFSPSPPDLAAVSWLHEATPEDGAQFVPAAEAVEVFQTVYGVDEEESVEISTGNPTTIEAHADFEAVEPDPEEVSIQTANPTTVEAVQDTFTSEPTDSAEIGVHVATIRVQQP